MKFIQSFDQFMSDTVNLNQTRVDAVTSGIGTVKTFLKNNELFGDVFKDVSSQGSYQQGTIIKPVSDKKEFDVDILFEMQEVPEWDPKDYLNKLHGEFKNTDRYKDIVDRRGKNRCVTLDYANDFHIDIVPCIQKDGEHKIMNKNLNEFEDTDGDGYALWFNSRNAITGSKHLVKVVRLIKYLRDSKQTFSAKSILLTTLLGNHVYDTDGQGNYPDVPTALKTLLGRLDDYLQANSSMPTITNPTLSTEDFNRHWDQEKYTNFRDRIHDYRVKVDEAYDSDDEEESLEKWTEVFGDDFPTATSTGSDESQNTPVAAPVIIKRRPPKPHGW